MEFSITELWHTMTILGKATALSLLVMSLWLIAVCLERVIAYSTGSKQSYQFVLGLRDHMQQARLDAAVASAEAHKKSPIARVMHAGLKEFQAGLGALRAKGPQDVGEFDLVDAVNRSLERVKERETAGLRKGLGGIATIASISPFVGLLGTVVGIIGAFQKLKGGGGMEVVGPSISEALIMTAFGLLVAIPAAIMFNYFTGRVETFVVDMNDVSSDFVDYVLKEGRAR